MTDQMLLHHKVIFFISGELKLMLLRLQQIQKAKLSSLHLIFFTSAKDKETYGLTELKAHTVYGEPFMRILLFSHLELINQESLEDKFAFGERSLMRIRLKIIYGCVHQPLLEEYGAPQSSRPIR